MVFGMVHPYIFIHFMKMFFVLVSLVFSIHCIHVCVEKEDWEMYVWCNLSKEAFPEQGKVCMTDVTLRRHRRRRDRAQTSERRGRIVLVLVPAPG